MRRHAAAALLLEQRLRDHRLQRLREHGAHHRLLLRREDVDDAVDGLGGGLRVQRAEDHVTGLGGLEREADGLEVAQLADEDDVRVFPQRRAQGLVEAVGVAVHLALVHEALLGFVHELDRVLDREDVLVLVVVDVVDHRRERRRLAGARGARHQHHAAGLLRDVDEALAHAEVFHGQDLRRDRPEDGAGAAVLVEGIDAEAGDAGHLEGEVRLEELLEVLALLVVHDLVDEGLHFLVIHGRQVDAPHVAVHADHRRQARRQVQVRGALLGAEGEQFGDIHGSLSGAFPGRARVGGGAGASCARAVADEGPRCERS